ncbi:MAG TPA: TonB family protein [Myxococcota bacterium]|nr:TonB family protein [Myxococcota bacterium]
MNGIRILTSASLAALVTLGLFWAMTRLIEVPADEAPPPPPLRPLDRVNVRVDTPATSKARTKRPERRAVHETPEPVLRPEGSTSEPYEFVRFDASEAGQDESGRSHAPRLFRADGEAVPLVRVPPHYPERALARGLEGRVLVEFTIGRTGDVTHAHVVAFEPSPIFNDAALEAVRQWRYSPRVVDGEPVEQPGQRVSIPFRREDAAKRDAG